MTNYSIIQNLKVIGELQLAQATPAQIAAFEEFAMFLSAGNRPSIKKDGVTEETAFLSDLTDFLTAAEIQQNINNAVAAVEGAVRYAGHFSPVATGEMPIAADNIVDGELASGDMFVVTENGTIDTSNIEYFGNQDTTAQGDVLNVTKGDQLIYLGLAGDGSAKWSHADDPFFDTLATATDYGIVKLLDAAAVGTAVSSENENSAVTYAGLVAMQSLIETGYTEAIAAAETAAAVQRYVVSTTYPAQLVGQLATLTGGQIDVTAPTLPTNPTLAQRDQYLVDLANTTYTAFQQLDTVLTQAVADIANNATNIAGNTTAIDANTAAIDAIETEVTNRLKIEDGRNRVNAKPVGDAIELGTDGATVFTVEDDGAGTLAFAGYTGNAFLENDNLDTFALLDAAGNFVTFGRVASGGSDIRFVSATDTDFPAGVQDLFVNGGQIKDIELVTAIEESWEVAQIRKHLRDDLEGNESNAAPSVAAVKTAIDAINAATGDFVKYFSETEQVIDSDVAIGGLSELVIVIPDVDNDNYGYYTHPAPPFNVQIVIDGVDYSADDMSVGETFEFTYGTGSGADGQTVSGVLLSVVESNTANGPRVTLGTDLPGGSLPEGADFFGTLVITQGSSRNLHVTGKNYVDNLPQVLTGEETNEAPSVAAVKAVADNLQTQIDDLSVGGAGGEQLYTVTETEWVQDGDEYVKSFTAPQISESAGLRQYSHGSLEYEMNGSTAILSPTWNDQSTRISFELRLPFAPTELRVYSSLIPGELIG